MNAQRPAPADEYDHLRESALETMREQATLESEQWTAWIADNDALSAETSARRYAEGTRWSEALAGGAALRWVLNGHEMHDEVVIQLSSRMARVTLFGGDEETIGQSTRRRALAEDPNAPDYDPTRALADDETRCEDCGFISRDGTHAQLAHDDLCDVKPSDL